MILNRQWSIGELGKIQMSLAVYDMIIQPIANWFDIAVPRIDGAIGVTVIARTFEDSLNVIRNIVAF